jgi:hypothetical protein
MMSCCLSFKQHTKLRQCVPNGTDMHWNASKYISNFLLELASDEKMAMDLVIV